MRMNTHTIVGLGEILWDLFPEGKQLGGAPANFAYMASLLGDRGIVASRVGTDLLGAEVQRKLESLGLETSFLELDPTHPTGTVKVAVAPDGQPSYEITEEVAWDFVELGHAWESLALRADAVCFGSLAQRSRISRDAIHAFLEAVRPGTARVFDVNLRQAFYSAEIVSESLKLADVVKLNFEELPRVMELLDLGEHDEELSARRLLQASSARLVCVTRGESGSLLVTSDRCNEHPGFRVPVVDTVGAGDAFAAALVHHFLRGSSLEEMSEAANRMGAWVASRAGATPVADSAIPQRLRVPARE
jgi:fructokinase